MRISILLLATSSCAHAAWLRWSVNREPVWAAQETGHVMKADQTGWTPIPTPAPGLRKDSEIVLDLLRRETKSTNWTNSETCGWFSGISSSALVCGNDFSCATNSQHAVACVSGTLSPFFSACLDYSAFKAGSCLSLDGATGCCQQETEPACGTYIWTGSPERFMYKCFEKASIVSMLDVPQFVIDASIFSQTHTTPKPTTTTTSGTTTNGPGPDPGSGSGPGSGAGSSPDNSGGGDPNSATALPGSSAGDGSGSGSTTNDSSNPGPNNTPIIVGAAVGGLAGLLLLLLLLLFCLRRKTKGKLGLGLTRNKKNKKEDNSSKTFHSMNINAAAKRGHSSGSDTTTVAPVPLQPQQQHHYYHNQEQHHYHSQGQVQSLPGQQPVSVTVNEHSRQPSISSNTTYMAAPSNSAAGPHFVLGGVIPMAHSKDERGQPQLQRQQVQQPPPQNQGFAGVSQPVPGSTTMNEGNTHMRQPSYSQNSYAGAPSSSGGHSQYVVGGIVPMGHHSNEQQTHQQFQPGQAMAPQMQPVNHIHVYYAPAPAPAPTQHSNEQHISSTATSSQYSSTYTSPDPNVQVRGGGGGGDTQDVLGIYMRSSEFHQSRSHSHSRSESRSRSPGQTHINIQAQASAQANSQSQYRSHSPSESRSRSPDQAHINIEAQAYANAQSYSHSQPQGQMQMEQQQQGGYVENQSRDGERSPRQSRDRGRERERDLTQKDQRYEHDHNQELGQGQTYGYPHNNDNRDVSAVSSSASSRRSPSPEFYDDEWSLRRRMERCYRRSGVQTDWVHEKGTLDPNKTTE